MAGDGARARRLGPSDAAAFRALRFEGLARHPELFRVALEDEADLPLDHFAALLAADHVVGVDHDGALAGVAGFRRFAGARLSHKGLLWGMYLRTEARGQGLADVLVGAIIDHAQGQVDRIVLTVMADNTRAQALYARWGFALYGVEPGGVLVNGAPRDEGLMIRLLGKTRAAEAPPPSAPATPR